MGAYAYVLVLLIKPSWNLFVKAITSDKWKPNYNEKGNTYMQDHFRLRHHNQPTISTCRLSPRSFLFLEIAIYHSLETLYYIVTY